MQVQFIVLGTLASLCLMNLHCEEVQPAQRIYRFMALLQSIIMLFMFTNFYRKTYRKKTNWTWAARNYCIDFIRRNARYIDTYATFKWSQF